MARGYVSLLAIVAAIWGSSYLFIKVAGRGGRADRDDVSSASCLPPRCSSPVLAWHVGGRAAVTEMRGLGWKAWAVGFLNAAFPFTLIAWGEKYVDSGVAAIANASVPIFVVILAFWFNPSERVRGVRLAGILVGLAGVAVLTGLHPDGGWWAIAGTLAIVVASLSYAAANHFVQHNFSQTMPILVTTASAVMGAVILLPFAAFQMPEEMPSWKAIGSIVVLGVLGTAFALLLYYRLLTSYGAARASLVTYLLPPVALVYGVLILDEQITLNAALGLVLILAGVALGSGAARGLRRRGREAEAAPATPQA